jgi:hypothetical protein
MVCAHKPILFGSGIGDDGLFISMGQHLANGEWLGPFGGSTLMKGPGYPMFLAINYYLGLSVSMAHAVFFCICLGLFSWMISRVFHSPWLKVLLFILTLWYPVFVGESILRESIYSGQVFLVLACFLAALFVARDTLSRLGWGSSAGLALGWFWLTREEGIWVLPGVALLFLAGIAHSWTRKRSVRPLVVPVASASVVFLCSQFAFATANWLAYGSFVGVDVKESAFQAAYSALLGVQDGDHFPRVAVSRSTREHIYRVSPTFSTLKEYLDQPLGPLKSHFDEGCLQLSYWTCGELRADMFLWGLRAAAAYEGHFRSPAAEAKFFRKVADEVNAGCRSGQLRCNPGLIHFMPPLSMSQLKQIPATAGRSISWLMLRFPLEGYSPVGPVTPDLLTLNFLNYPPYSPPSGRTRYAELDGWYYLRADQWPRISIVDPRGDLAPLSFFRQVSPDIEKYFNDSGAGRQRFTIYTVCELNCDLLLEQSTSQLRVKLAEIVDGKHSFQGSYGQFFIDSAIARDQTNLGYPSKLSAEIRRAVYWGYQIVMPVVLPMGIAAFFAAALLSWITKSSLTELAISASVWLLLGCRVLLLVLMDVSSSPGLTSNYLSPALYLSIAAPILSIGSLIKVIALYRGRTMAGYPAQSTADLTCSGAPPPSIVLDSDAGADDHRDRVNW